MIKIKTNKIYLTKYTFAVQAKPQRQPQVKYTNTGNIKRLTCFTYFFKISSVKH